MQPLTIKQAWVDKGFSVSVMEQINPLVEKLAGNSGKNHLLLFYGPAGSGKKMTASMLANSLKREICRVDLLQVKSEFTRETEKNLSALFDKAEKGNYILFLDEAETLFSKRTEVKDSHDKYSNQEINYLMQRMENYSGVIILSTNDDQPPKEFLQRFSSVSFPPP